MKSIILKITQVPFRIQSRRNITIFAIGSFIFACMLQACDKQPGTKDDTIVENSELLNGDFEEWEGSGKEIEPAHWNSFMSASGSGMAYTAARAQQVDVSDQTRPGSTGTKSACIYTRSILGVIANGNLTTGQIHVGSVSATNANNYNITRSDHADYHQVITSRPDSIRFWAKFKCPDASQMARMSATLHDSCDYRDPETTSDAAHVVAKAYKEFSTQSGEWICYTIPFSYDYPSQSPKYMLITFTTNKEAGKGSITDTLFLDDVELIYK